MSRAPRIAALEAGIDARLQDVYAMLPEGSTDEDRALLRAAFGVGYVTALREDPPGQFAREHGYGASGKPLPESEPEAATSRLRRRVKRAASRDSRTMGADEYFWSYEFRFDLRDAPRAKQEEIRRRFTDAKLRLAGFTKRHIVIVEEVLGRKAHARQSPHAPKSMQPKAVTLDPREDEIFAAAKRIDSSITRAAAYLIGELNAMALADERGDVLANHTPSAPLFWFTGLAQELGAQRGANKAGANVFASPKTATLLNREARARIRALGIEFARPLRVKAAA